MFREWHAVPLTSIRNLVMGNQQLYEKKTPIQAIKRNAVMLGLLKPIGYEPTWIGETYKTYLLNESYTTYLLTSRQELPPILTPAEKALYTYLILTRDHPVTPNFITWAREKKEFKRKEAILYLAELVSYNPNLKTRMKEVEKTKNSMNSSQFITTKEYNYIRHVLCGRIETLHELGILKRMYKGRYLYNPRLSITPTVKDLYAMEVAGVEEDKMTEKEIKDTIIYHSYNLLKNQQVKITSYHLKLLTWMLAVANKKHATLNDIKEQIRYMELTGELIYTPEGLEIQKQY